MKKEKTLIDSKWYKGVPRDLVNEIKRMVPTHIACSFVAPEITIAVVNTMYGSGVGIAICSTRDKENFKPSDGKTKALARALSVIKNRSSSEPIRNSHDEFPSRWQPSQKRRVLDYSFLDYKSAFVTGDYLAKLEKIAEVQAIFV